MGAECRYEVAQPAYIKLVLHALKHRCYPVGGLLVGRLSDADASTVQIADAIPLTHSQIGLLPSLELALIQVEEHFGAEGLSVVGYYHANERYDDAELGNAAKKIGDHIFRYFPRAALLLLENKRLEELLKGKGRGLAVQLYTRDSSKSWRQAGSDDSSQLLTIKEPSANIVLLDYITSEKWQDVVDFDDHLDDISKDWLNPDLFK
ncbi:ER membrane protein complex subunit 8/9 homolog [Phoenix dactylifera]|uniref:ER membrane protein complex subunit 8/9 homolog n=1 Tax=Phoenix dactylifera TaxID=42345 RepID=A0A8B8ZH13_PHODC|nr:ER membrane protein complex subunit 8/9 homolog [Phoenix dactylifera]XP_038973439.1 ER membrane protein complex subunit 8/9 homolog [Phoenix dactylifera]XP_038973440.1 ER membrane protein complex subunit 8/9 homolog [Phoenix dactylifera]